MPFVATSLLQAKGPRMSKKIIKKKLFCQVFFANQPKKQNIAYIKRFPCYF